MYGVELVIQGEIEELSWRTTNLLFVEGNDRAIKDKIDLLE